MFPNGYELPPLSLACPVGGGTAQVGVAYSKFLVASGGTPPYTFSIIAGALPPGLTLNASTGEISGTPTTAGTYPYEAQVTDAAAETATAECEIVIYDVLAAACPLNIQIPVGVPYYGEIIVTGGIPPYTFALTAGAFPTGITLDTVTGVISGTTTDPLGDYSYTIEVTDANMDTVEITCGITVGCPGMASRLVDGAAASPALTASGSGGTTLRSLL